MVIPAMDSHGILRAWPYLAACALLAYYLVSTARSYSRLRQFKGPRLAAFSRLWFVRAAISGKTHLYFAHVSTEYGWLARIGPNTLLTTDLELYKKMNAVRSPYRKSDWYRGLKFDADKENLLSEVDEEKRASMRSRVTAGYTGKDSPEFEGDMDRVLWALFDLIKQKYNSTGSTLKPMDLARIIQYFTLDVITSLGLGHPFGFITEGDDVDKYEYVKTLEDNFPYMFFISAVPLLAKIMSIPFVQRMAMPTVRDRIGMGKVKAVTAEIIARRFGEKKEVRQDMVQSFLTHGLTQAEIADETLLQILAGSDTSASVLRATFVSIISNPRVYSRLQEECKAANVPWSEIIAYTQAQALPYLVACVREGLRHRPAATGLLPRVTGPQGEHHNGIFIPPNTEIGICAWNMHRNNTAVYGEDAGVFRPERWIDNSADKLREMERAQDLVFGFGRYRCLGERIAKVELHKAIFELMRRFDWSFVDPTKPLESSMNYGIFQERGMWVRVSDKPR